MVRFERAVFSPEKEDAGLTGRGLQRHVQPLTKHEFAIRGGTDRPCERADRRKLPHPRVELLVLYAEDLRIPYQEILHADGPNDHHRGDKKRLHPVSYTHLTLPTILRV